MWDFVVSRINAATCHTLIKKKTGHSLKTSPQVILCMLTLSVGQQTAAPSDPSLKVLLLYSTHVFMAISYGTSIHYRLIVRCMLRPVLFVLHMSSSLKRKCACDFVLSFSFDILCVD